MCVSSYPKAEKALSGLQVSEASTAIKYDPRAQNGEGTFASARPLDCVVYAMLIMLKKQRCLNCA